MSDILSEEDAIGIFDALSDKTRLNIVRELMNGEKPCSELIAKFDLSKSTFSHHAKVLAGSGLVKFRREGRFLFFSLQREMLEKCINLLK